MQDSTSLYLLIAIGGLMLIFLVVNVAMWLQGFCKELEYLNREIARTSGEEQAHWKRRKRRLLLSLIPFVGR